MEMILRLLLRRLMALPVMILGVTALVLWCFNSHQVILLRWHWVKVLVKRQNNFTANHMA